MKKFLAVFLIVAMLLSSLAVTAGALEPNGWRKGEYGWQYIQNGKPVSDMWIQDKGAWYYIGADTYMYADEFLEVTDAKGTVTAMYYLQPDGRMLAGGWKSFNRVYLNDSGASVKSTDWIYAGSDGKLAMDGWKQIGGAWYYFDGIWMVSDGVWKIKGVYYYFRESGVMAVGWCQPWLKKYDDTDWAYADQSGALVSGWKQIDKKWYYFGEGDGVGWLRRDMAVWIENKQGGFDVYAFGKDGAMITNAWYAEKYAEGGISYTDWYYLTGNGLAAKGWKNVGGTWYYLDPDCGIMWTGKHEIGGYVYNLGTTGAMKIGWSFEDNCWFYYKSTGAMARNEWLKINNKWYFFDTDGAMLYGGTYTLPDGKNYTFDQNGVWVK